jgi:large subunit ribosomal protein L18
MSIINRKSIRQRIHKRIRNKVTGTAERPRLAVHYSNQHIYAQVIDDSVGKTLISASTMDKSFEKASSNVESAQKVGATPRGARQGFQHQRRGLRPRRSPLPR